MSKKEGRGWPFRVEKEKGEVGQVGSLERSRKRERDGEGMLCSPVVKEKASLAFVWL